MAWRTSGHAKLDLQTVVGQLTGNRLGASSVGSTVGSSKSQESLVSGYAICFAHY